MQLESTLKQPLTWEVGHAASASDTPDRFVPASVPGAVQLDWARAEGWPPYWQGAEYKRYAWMEDVYWTYRARLAPQQVGYNRAFLVFRGVDYAFEIWIDGKRAHVQEGMFRPVEIDVTDRLGTGALVQVLVHPVPKYAGAGTGRGQASHSVKPAVSYGWDFHPRLVPLGIWDEAYLELRPETRIVSSRIRSELSADRAHAHVNMSVEIAGQAAAELAWTVTDHDGAVVIDESAEAAAEVELRAPITSPRMWWPHDQGEPHLYTSKVTLRDREGGTLHELVERFGIRTVRLVLHPGAWSEGSGPAPCTRPHPPTTFEVNGRRIFVKGANWVPPNIFPGAIDEPCYRAQLQLVKGMHMNMVRSWGGGIVNKEAFFDLCDELGIMVWQEFPLACNFYPDDPHYLGVLDSESRAIIERLRRHPCVALWCAGNELFNSWSGMNEQSKPIRLLARNTYDLDPDRPFLPTSPVHGVGHGHYRFRDELGREVYRIYGEATYNAYAEFGCPGPADLESIKTFIPEAELDTPRPGGAWEDHHAFRAWDPAGESGSWLYLDIIESYFGTGLSLERIVELGQWMQAEGYRAIYEEIRRQRPRAGFALAWCLNEPWPTAANNCIIAWPHRPKPACAAVRAACRPSLLCAKIPRFTWRPGQIFEADLWVLNDAPRDIEPFSMRASLEIGEHRVDLGTWQFDRTPANENRAGPTVRALLPDAKAERLVVRLCAEKRADLDSEYVLQFCSP